MHVGVLLPVFLFFAACMVAAEPALDWSDFESARDKVVAIVDAEGPAAALNEVRTQRNGRGIVADTCHALVHEVGHAAFQKFRDIPAALAFHDPLCNGAYIHGVIEYGLLGSKNLIVDLQDLCTAYDPQSFLGVSCFHGIGHGLMYATENDLTQSLGACSSLPDYGKAPCENGVFMELFSADRQLHLSDLLVEDDPFQPCPAMQGEQRTYCYLYAPIYYLSLHDRDYDAALGWCATAETFDDRHACGHGVGGLMMNDHLGDPTRVERLCEDGPEPLREGCLAGMVRMWIYNAVNPETRDDICGEMLRKNRGICRKMVEEYEETFNG